MSDRFRVDSSATTISDTSGLTDTTSRRPTERAASKRLNSTERSSKATSILSGVEVKHVRRKDFDPEKRLIHIRTSKNQTSKRVIPLNDSAFDAVQRMVKRSDVLGHSEPEHYLWCASQHHKLDPMKPARKWDTAWRALRDAAGLPGLRFHDLRHTVVTRLLEAGEPDHVVESITGHLSRRMLEHYSHIRLNAKKAALDRLDQSSKAPTIKATK